MPNQTAADDVRLFHCTMPSANPAERWDDPVPALRREMKLLLVERELMRTEQCKGVISRISGVPLNDYGCTLKAYRRDILQGMRL
jgi:hypothetical protein